MEGALLAAKGYEGPEPIFEGREGLGDCISEEWKWDIVTDGLGDSYRILNCSMKGAPVEALIHTPLTVALSLREKHGLDAADNVAEIRIKTIQRAAEILSDPEQVRSAHAGDRGPLASLLHRRCGRRRHGDHQAVQARSVSWIPALRPLMNKIEVVAEPEFEALFPRLQPCEVTVKMTDGSTSPHGPHGLPHGRSAQPDDAPADGEQVRRSDRGQLLSEAPRRRGSRAPSTSARRMAPTIRELMETFVGGLGALARTTCAAADRGGGEPLRGRRHEVRVTVSATRTIRSIPGRFLPRRRHG